MIDKIDDKGFNRFFHGGSWINYSRVCTVSSRYLNFPYDRYGTIGFRITRTAKVKNDK
jgi:formylglycine-generating enzyme required for sulfatase activity